MNVAVMMPNWVGDAVMATPAIRALRESFPQARLCGVMRPHIAEVLEGTDWLNEIALYSRRASGELGDTGRLVRHLRELQIQEFLLFTNSLSTAWIAWRTGARQRIGFAREGRGWLLTHRLRAPRVGRKLLPRSAVDHYAEIVKAAGARMDQVRAELATVAADETAADRVWSKFQLEGASPVVIMNTGGAFGPAKNWPNEHFAQLAREVAERLGGAVLFLCGPAEREAVAHIVQQADHRRVHSLADEPLGIGLSKACVRRGDLMVSTDSGPRHFAAAFNVPLITLFGPTDPRWSDNYHRQSSDLEITLDCRPCARRTCPLGHHRCMKDLSPSSVLAEVERWHQLAVKQRESSAVAATIC